MPRRFLWIVIVLAPFVALAAFALVNAKASAQDQATQPATQPTTRHATQPATRPATQPESADAVLERLLRPATRSADSPDGERALPAERFAGESNNATGRAAAAVAPDAPRLPLVREGTYVIDRLGSVRQSVDGRGLELVFAADGETPAAALDPPMLLAPNLHLMSVEAAASEEPETRFRVTGRVSEYRGRNYLLLEKVVVVVK